MIGALEHAGYAIARQDVDRSVRSWMWAESLSMCPQEQIAALEAATRAAATETEANAEFLTFVARKPS